MFRSCRSRYVCRCSTTIHLFSTQSPAMVRMAWCVDGQWTGPTTSSPSDWESGGRGGPHPRPVACWVGPLSKPTEPSWVGGGRGRLEGDPEGGTGRPCSLAMGVPPCRSYGGACAMDGGRGNECRGGKEEISLEGRGYLLCRTGARTKKTRDDRGARWKRKRGTRRGRDRIEHGKIGPERPVVAIRGPSSKRIGEYFLNHPLRHMSPRRVSSRGKIVCSCNVTQSRS